MAIYEEMPAYPRPLDPVQVHAINELVNDLRPERILEVGCATGKLLAHLRKLEYSPVGVDLNLALIQTIDKSPVFQADANDLPFADRKFDLVIANHIVEHTEHVGSFVNELARVTAPDGKIFLSYPDEPIRGLFATGGSLMAYGHPFWGYKLHLQTVRPEDFDQLGETLPIKPVSTIHRWLPMPQYITILSKEE